MNEDSQPAGHHLRGPLILAAGSMLDADAETLVDAASAAGFDGVGLRLSGPHVMNPAGAARIAARCVRAGLRVHDTEVFRIGTDTGPDVMPEAPHRLPPLAHNLIEVSAAAGAATLLVVSDHPDEGYTTDLVGSLVEAAIDHDLEIGLEYMAWTTPADPGGAVAMARATGARIVVDVLHHVRVGAGADELRAVVESGLLGWVQVCDAEAGPTELGPADAATHDRLITEARHGRLLPGHGSLPLHDLLAVVPATTPISVEVQSDRLLSMAPADRARTLAQATHAVIRR
jgi:sugar phosphate isomerase/epimerase